MHQKQIQTEKITKEAIAKRTVGEIQDIPDITKSTGLKNLEEIFEPINSKCPKSILIEGHPGIGKTMFVKEICVRWAQGKLLTSYQLVLLLTLKDPKVWEITSVQELIEFFMTPTLNTSKLKLVHHYLEDTHGANVTLIIDGFDELGNVKLNQESFITGLIKAQVLNKATIVITSCPSISLCLHKMVDKRIEILGFGNRSTEHFITENLKNYPEKARRLQQHLDFYPKIQGVCYLPLIMTILVFLCIQEDLPDTITELYTKFIMYTIAICHHLKREGRMRMDEKIASLEGFPKPVCDVLKKLEKVAFNGLLEGRIDFEEKDLPDHEICKSDPTCFGLLQPTRCYSAQDIGVPKLIFSFYHVHLQKYFAAKHVMCLPENEASELVAKYLFIKYEYAAYIDHDSDEEGNDETITNDRGDDGNEDNCHDEDCEVDYEDEEEADDNDEFEETYRHNDDDQNNDEFIAGHFSDMWLFLFGLTNGYFSPLKHYLSTYCSDKEDDNERFCCNYSAICILTNAIILCIGLSHLH